MKLAINKETGEKVAIKISRRENSREFARKEFKILKKLDQKTIIRPIELLENDLKDETYVVLEHFEGINLAQYVREKGLLAPEAVEEIAETLTECISYLHSKGIAHRDIKPENLLINEDLEVKLIDFNISKEGKKLEGDRTCKFKKIFYTQISSPLYAAPELRGKELYTESVDIWGIGAVVYTCLFGKPTAVLGPFKDNLSEVTEKLQTECLSEVLNKFISTCLDTCQDSRPSAEELLELF